MTRVPDTDVVSTPPADNPGSPLTDPAVVPAPAPLPSNPDLPPASPGDNAATLEPAVEPVTDVESPVVN